MTAWLRTTKRRTCPICGKPDWCSIAGDGTVVHCMRIESDRPFASGGWLHRLGPDVQTSSPRPARRPMPTEAPPDLPAQDFEAMLARYGIATAPGDLRRLADELGLTAGSLTRLGAVYAAPHRAWAFPMRDRYDTIVGIRLRSDRGKWAITGSHNGLFIPNIASGAAHEPPDPIVICEGPTDTAAMLDLGFFAIGRPACRGCERDLAGLLHRRQVVILADRDEPKHRPDGTEFYPGQEGAAHLANELLGRAATVKIILPLKGKDARAWLAAGATHDIVAARIQTATCTTRPRPVATPARTIPAPPEIDL